MSRLETLKHHDESEDEACEPLIESCAPALIFDAENGDEPIPEPFDAVKILLDGTLKADLRWEHAKHLAQRYAEQGLKIFWEIELGLFDKLVHPLNHQAQFLSLGLSLEHFKDTIWTQFAKQTVGLCLYRGPADFSLKYRWDKEQRLNLQVWMQELFNTVATLQNESEIAVSSFSEIDEQLLSKYSKGRTLLNLFCGDVAAEYFDLLAKNLPQALKCFLLFEVAEQENPMLVAQMLSSERFSQFSIGAKGANGLGGELAWEDQIELPLGAIARHWQRMDRNQPKKIGICLPEIRHCCKPAIQKLNEVVLRLKDGKMPFKIIPENRLAAEWEGLDYLIVTSDEISQQGRRKLQGFSAAGGGVVRIGKPLGLLEEFTFEDWWEQFK